MALMNRIRSAMKIFSLLLLLMVFYGSQAVAQNTTPEDELTQLLFEFLEGASTNDAEMHDRFWAEDLIYTSSAGERFGKAEIMEGLENTATDAPAVEYSAENIQIQVYGDVAVVAFRLIGKSPTENLSFLNSGTFLKRDGHWKVINWQATREN